MITPKSVNDAIRSALKKKKPRYSSFEDKHLGGALRKAFREVHSLTRNTNSPSWTYDFRKAVIHVSVLAIVHEFIAHYNELMSGEYRLNDKKNDDLISGSRVADLIKGLKKLAQEQIFVAPSILRLELMGNVVIGDLLSTFWEGAMDLPTKEDELKTKSFSQKAATLLSENYRSIFYKEMESKDLPELYRRLHLLTDYICGMTDSFATHLHAELNNRLMRC